MVALKTTRKNDALKRRVLSFIAKYAVIILTLILVIVVSCLQKSFFTTSNLKNIMNQVAVNGIVAAAMTFVLVTGNVDLSVGSILSCACVATALLVNAGHGAMAYFVPALFGMVIGAVSGLLMAVTRGRMGESFLITYGMQLLLAAVALLISGGMYIAFNSYTGSFIQLGKGMTPFLAFLLIVVVCQLAQTYTAFGRNIMYLGANPTAAELSGIRIPQHMIAVFSLAGLLSGFAGTVLAARVMCAQPTTGTGYEMDAIAACVVGGVSMTGGKGTFLNTLIGVLIIGILSNALNLLKISTNPQFIVKGCVIILAVSLDILSQKLERE